MDILASTIGYFANAPFWELVAVGLSIAYVILVAHNSIWCWPAALISTFIFTVIFYDVSLLMESLLNGYYMVMAVYGWYCWQRSSQVNHGEKIIRWPLRHHLVLVLALSLLSLLLGWYMANYTQADFAYLDTFTTVFAMATTYLVAIKVFENWWYWIVINTASVYLYLQKGLEPTACLAMFNIVMCFIGIYRWHSAYKLQLAPGNGS
ncbi:nicotinamide riboside transporter PnuC [Thalassotalea ponticola]|uniref:nicotinamide riboside transporter PnuC n=1 Tax=Thalassotalea ponticola TaxID=1523392 RepID=UPI0025B55F72|nr:nicotinamide riboside transporter PnuC [Thalassotalea ponticola]MDN3651540.1 nicotinamide riboside transporter PnuC [Thalassotalea ponticola]